MQWLWPLTNLPTLLLCNSAKVTASLLVKLLSVNSLAMLTPNWQLSPQPDMFLLSSEVAPLTEKSQLHDGNSCSLHFLAISLAIPALMMALRNAVSRVPVNHIA